MTVTLNVWAWSTTAADNDDIDSAINWAEGQDPGSVNNSARAMMSATKLVVNALAGGVTVGGTADVITITTGQNIESAQQGLGLRLGFKASGTNTGAVTVNVDGLGAVAVKRPNGDALSAGDIVSGGIYDIAHDGTNYKLMGAGAGAGTYSTLSGDNTFTGTNIFQGNTTIGDGSGDTVVIKGTTVNSYMSGLLSTSSAANLRAALSLGTAALKNTGTSGDAVPLLNQSNTFAIGQIISGSGGSPLTINRTDAANGFQIIGFSSSSVGVGQITYTQSGPSVNGVAYNTTSDGRLKEAATPIEDSGDIIDRLNPVRFTWLRSGARDFGFIAQEVDAVIPGIVTPGSDQGPDDEDFFPWMMQHGRMEAIAIAELKSLRQRVAQLESVKR